MSGIAGIYNLDGRPVDPALPRRMTAAIAHRGPDGIHHWISGSVGLGHCMLQTTPESLHEHQPLLNETGDVVLTLDGRVANREDLRATLESKGARLRDDTDAELVLQLYQVWGKECPRQIIGDFAFVIWDGRRRQLFAARDIMGARPFYYYVDARRFLFASDVQSLFVEGLEVAVQPNDGMIGEYLSNFSIRTLHETLYQNIFRLPPAHALTVKDGHVKRWRYYDPDPGNTIRYRRDEEYADHFFSVFREVVHDSLRGDRPVAILLSGGVDSSSLVGMAALLRRERTLAVPEIGAYSLTFSHPDADERSYITDVIAKWNVDAHAIDCDPWRPPVLEKRIAQLRDFPDFPNTAPWGPLYSVAKAQGCRVLLWGWGGDEWLTGHWFHCADLLKRLHVLALGRQLRADLKVSNSWGGWGIPASTALRWTVFPLLPRSWKLVLRRWLNRGVPTWIAPAFARRTALAERLSWRPETLSFPTHAQQAIYEQLHSGVMTTTSELVNRFEAEHEIEGRSPFNDRRMIEFALALPEEQRWRNEETKFVLRQAARRFLPESVRQRMTKADFTFLSGMAVAQEPAEAVVKSSHLIRAGYLDGPQVKALCQGAREGNARCFDPLWLILALEYWYRRMFCSSPSATGYR
jgi:asparagine synthase (glutamine-hydrolysing)